MVLCSLALACSESAPAKQPPPLGAPEPTDARELSKCRGIQCVPEPLRATRLGDSCQFLLPADFSDDDLERLVVTLGGKYVYLSSWGFGRLTQGPVLSLLEPACEQLRKTPAAALHAALHCGSSACQEQVEAERDQLVGDDMQGECGFTCDELHVKVERVSDTCSFVIVDQGPRVASSLNYIKVNLDGQPVRHRDWRYSMRGADHLITLLGSACDALRAAGDDVPFRVAVTCKGYYCAERRPSGPEQR